MMTDLPPKPDLATGEPRPPKAPTQFPEPDSDARPVKTPSAPPGQSPVIAHYRLSKTNTLIGTLGAGVLVLGMIVFINGVKTLTMWFTWVIMAAYIVFLIYSSRTELVRAGVDWVAGNNRWVRTYELTKIRYLSRGAGGTDLELTDREGRALSLPLNRIQSNHGLWDYVYLGMRHSTAHGAELNHTARVQFPELNGSQ